MKRQRGIGWASVMASVVGCSLHLADGGSEVAVVSGVVQNGAGAPVADVSVSHGSAATRTDAEGQFRLQTEYEGDRIVLAVSAVAYAPSVAIVHPRPSVYHYNTTITLASMTELPVGEAGATMTVGTASRSARVTVPRGALPNGARIRVAAYDPRTGPGALDTPDPPGANRLQSLGMFRVEAVDQAGDPIAMAAGVSIELPARDLGEVQGAGPMQLWGLNEQGQWAAPRPLAAGGAVGGATINVPSRGYWNADRNYQTACVIGRVQTPRLSCSGQAMRADGPDGISSFDNARSDGSFCLEGAQTWMSTVVVGSTTRSVTMPSRPGNCANPASCTRLAEPIMASDADCPNSCPLDQVDAPGGCQARPSSETPSGFYCSSAANLCSSANCHCPSIQYCLRITGTSCVGYYLAGGRRFDVADCTNSATLSAAADATVAYCTGR